MNLRTAKSDKFDVVDVLEAAYRIDLHDEPWLRSVVDAACLDHGMGTQACVMDMNRLDDSGGPAIERRHFWGTPPEFDELVPKLPSTYSPDGLRQMFVARETYTSIRTILGKHYSTALGVIGSTGIVDAVSIAASEQGGHQITLLGLRDRQVQVQRRDSALWNRLAPHIATAHRLRQRMCGENLDAPGVDAVLRPDGRCLEARGAARSRSALDELREAALRVDRARSAAGRACPEEALELWQGLISGRWSLVDHFDSDGRRFVVARQNRPDTVDPRRLTTREEQIARHAMSGASHKEIAFALQISPSAVSIHLKAALRKLGMSSAGPLRALGAAAGDALRAMPRASSN